MHVAIVMEMAIAGLAPPFQRPWVLQLLHARPKSQTPRKLVPDKTPSIVACFMVRFSANQVNPWPSAPNGKT